MESLYGSKPVNISCHVIDNLPISFPASEELQTSVAKSRLRKLNLADPTFVQGGNIELILGASIFWPSLLPERIDASKHLPTLQKTIFGWIIGGSCACESLVPYSKSPSINLFGFEKASTIDVNLQRFWELEDGSLTEHSVTGNHNSSSYCENLFCETTQIASDGKFIVQLPLKQNPQILGDSKKLALQRLFTLEKRLAANEKLRTMYVQFMQEYIALNHMSLVPKEEEENKPAYYIPHLGVLRESSLTTKLRVVFNASAKTDTNKSLNEILDVGPTVQDTLFEILLRFREYPVAVTADITKMYRQIWIDPAQRDLQRILWRETPSHPVQVYRLNTVTYGTGPAPFLAIRSLTEAALQHKNQYPRAALSILKSFYVDDFLGGGQTVSEVIQLKTEIEYILLSRGMPLRKWASSNSQIFQDSSNLEPFYFNEENNTTALGLGWQPTTDQLFFKAKMSPIFKTECTKRTILSETSKLFDPLGLASPVIVRAKFLLQKIWRKNLKWDDKVNVEIQAEWRELHLDFQKLNECKIPRHLSMYNDKDMIIHGFSDASFKGYGACMYVSVVINSTRISRLICSKSRVTPLLKPPTLPRLELAGALLLVKLAIKVINALQNKPVKTFLWTDSAIVLHWIANVSSKWQVFIANRVEKIQSITEQLKACWCHVSSKNNPADLISRGTSARYLLKSEFWWNGPSFLSLEETSWPQTKVNIPQFPNIPEIGKETRLCMAISKIPCILQQLLNRFSSLQKVIRVLSFVIKFIQNLPQLKAIRKHLKKKTNEEIKKQAQNIDLSAKEVESTLHRCIRIIQNETFHEEILHLSQNHCTLQSSSNIQTLHPFLDNKNLLRVGGRLQNSSLSYEEKHPILLPKKHRFTELLFWQEHIRLHHAPPQMLLANIRQRFWPLHGPVSAKRIVNSCMKCRRVQPKPYSQLMAPLPSSRVIINKPFVVIGIDYVGPLIVQISSRKNAQIKKMYVVIFVCFVSKAIHLELVENLTTSSFIDTFKRYTARRGLPSKVYSDNSKTFEGANNELIKLGESQEMKHYLATNGITWNFNPANSPHHGGLWEISVKNFKSHLYKMSRSRKFRFLELTTLVTQIEAVLNSRPLVPLSSSPDDYEALTPGHFLIGRPLMAFPTNLESISVKCPNVKKAYKNLKENLMHFWKRWQSQYLQSLQSRAKWHESKSNIPIGALVVVKDRHTPPMFWNLGRVVEVHPGSDGRVRVVTVKTQSSKLVRGITEICPLPMNLAAEDVK